MVCELLLKNQLFWRPYSFDIVCLFSNKDGYYIVQDVNDGNGYCGMPIGTEIGPVT